MPEIKFIEVGRNKASWNANVNNVNDITYDWLYKQAKKHLLSSGIDFEFDNEMRSGKIFAGFRNVGRIEVV